jgi:DNA polymerase III delta prime subunit
MIKFLDTYKPQRIFLLQGDKRLCMTLYAQARERFSITHQLFVERFTVDNATEVSTFAIEGDGTERVLIVYFSVFSPDAAQVLLKSLEEPDLLTTIIFVTPYPYVVPLTIRSRVVLVHSDREIQAAPMLSKMEALEYVKKEFGKDSEEDAATRKAAAIAYLDQLEVRHRTDPGKASAIYQAKDMLLRANMPTKYVMEYVVSML